jgi:guanine deaminase
VTTALVVMGTMMQATAPAMLEVAEVVVAVDADGVIAAVHAAGSVAADAVLAEAERVVRLGPNQRLLPGMIDLHLHAPQWPQLGTGLDLPLEQWLWVNTFPLEARFADLAFAREVWSDMVPTLLAHGTTTAVYYATIDEVAAAALAEACVSFGQRAFVGRVAMDHPTGTPEWYRDPDAATAIARSRRSIHAIRDIDDGRGLVQPIVTPRFVPACTDELLHGLAALAMEEDVRVQTHCSESDWEHGYAIERYGKHDTAVLTEIGLIKPHSILAHGNHMTNEDFDLAAANGAGVAHCPLSNAYFADAVFPLQRALQRGVNVGLGSDVAGGAQPGLLAQSSLAVTASRMLAAGVDGRVAAAERGVDAAAIDSVTAFWLATAGGADALGIPAGRLTVGYVFDAFVVDLNRPHSSVRVWPGIDDERRIFEKIVRLAGSSDISLVWVNGRLVHSM